MRIFRYKGLLRYLTRFINSSFLYQGEMKGNKVLDLLFGLTKHVTNMIRIWCKFLWIRGPCWESLVWNIAFYKHFKFKNFHLSLQTHITDYVTRKRIIVFVWQLYREIYLHLKGVVTFAQCQQSRILKNFLLYQTIEFREKISKTSLMHMKFFCIFLFITYAGYSNSTIFKDWIKFMHVFVIDSS